VPAYGGQNAVTVFSRVSMFIESF